MGHGDTSDSVEALATPIRSDAVALFNSLFLRKITPYPNTNAASRCRDFSMGMRGATAEGKNASGEVLFEHRVGRCLDSIPAATGIKQHHAVQDLRQRNRGHEQARCRP
jgi:hypothetical protein